MRALILALPLLFASLLAAVAAPQAYSLDPGASKVQFVYTLSGKADTGTMPITRADLVLDFDEVSHSKAQVTLNAAGAQTGYFFATDALKSASVLNTAQFPNITFVSRKVIAQKGGARIEGDVTVRGVTRPMVLDAQIYRREGSDQGDVSRLTVLLTGQINRADFGATGYPDLVADAVKLKITARLKADN